MDAPLQHEDEPYRLLALAVFVDSRRAVLRSIHVHEQHGGACLHTIHQEFVLSKLHSTLSQIGRPVIFASSSRQASLLSRNVKQIIDSITKMHAEDGWHCVLEYTRDRPSEAFMPPLLMPSRNHDLKKIPSLEHDLILVEKALASAERRTHTWPFATIVHLKTASTGCGQENTKIRKDPSCEWHSPTLTLLCPSSGLSAAPSEHSSDTMPGLETPDRSSQGQPFDIWQNWGSDLELASPKVSLEKSVCPQQLTYNSASHSSSPNADSGASFWSPSRSLIDLNLDLSEGSYMGDHTDRVSQNSEMEASSFLNLELGMPSKLLVTQTGLSCSKSTEVATLLLKPAAAMPTSCDQDSLGNTLNIAASGMGGLESVISFSSSESNSNSFPTSSITNNSTHSTAMDVTHDTCTDLSVKDGHMSGIKSSGSVQSTSWHHAQPAYYIKLRCVKAGSTSERITEITYQEVSLYFGMPISQAAKKLKVGLTVLKKRCRALGIPRWPHRKMKSIDSLIHNVKDLANEQGTKSSPRVQNVVKELEQQKRIMEETPGIELAERTKKLRQACFKANYKKRRFSLIGGSSAHSDSFVSQCPSASVPSHDPPSFNLLDLNPALIVPPPSSDHCMMDHFL